MTITANSKSSCRQFRNDFHKTDHQYKKHLHTFVVVSVFCLMMTIKHPHKSICDCPFFRIYTALTLRWHFPDFIVVSAR